MWLNSYRSAINDSIVLKINEPYIFLNFLRKKRIRKESS